MLLQHKIREKYLTELDFALCSALLLINCAQKILIFRKQQAKVMEDNAT